MVYKYTPRIPHANIRKFPLVTFQMLIFLSVIIKMSCKMTSVKNMGKIYFHGGGEINHLKSERGNLLKKVKNRWSI